MILLSHQIFTKDRSNKRRYSFISRSYWTKAKY